MEIKNRKMERFINSNYSKIVTDLGYELKI